MRITLNIIYIETLKLMRRVIEPESRIDVAKG